MQFEKNFWYHVYNRGNNRQRIYFSPQNYLFFIRKIRNQITPLADVIAYCLMPNHFHLLIKVKPTTAPQIKSKQHPLVQKVAVLLSSYAKAINNQEDRSGSLFKAKTKAKNLSLGDRNYAGTCFHYIHQNPVKAALVKHPEDWKFSSYLDYAGLRNGTLPAKTIGFDAFQIREARHFIELSQQTLDTDKVKEIF